LNLTSLGISELFTDYNGISRPASGAWDLGCCQFQGGGGGTVATPTFTPGAGTYATAQTVTLSDATAGATICYMLNGGVPTAGTHGVCDSQAGTEFTYTTPLNVNSSETITAIGTLSGSTNSSVGTAAYIISPLTPQAVFAVGME
jgi:hypothetical protein